MRFLIDENIRKEVVLFLKSAGYDAVKVSFGSKDKEIAKLAKETKRIIVTHDHDFTDVWRYPPSEYPGIIRIKIHPPTAPATIHAMKDLLGRITAEQLEKKLVILEKDGFCIK